MYKRIESAKDLPKEWDELCKNNIYMSRSFMKFMEDVNYCNQSYHLFQSFLQQYLAYKDQYHL